MSIAKSAMRLATGKEVQGLDAMDGRKTKTSTSGIRTQAEARKPARNRKLKPEDFFKAIPGTFGNQSEIARRLGVNRCTVADYIATFPEVKAAFEQERESMADYVEGQLIANIKAGDPESIRFFLRTIGRRRGYGDRMEVTGQNGGAIIVQMTSEDAQG